MKPSMSVLVERSSPPSYHSVLAAPTARARASGLDSASLIGLDYTDPIVDHDAERKRSLAAYNALRAKAG